MTEGDKVQLFKSLEQPHYFVVQPSKTRYSLNSIAAERELVSETTVPASTQFSKLPDPRTKATRKEMVYSLRTQKTYWVEQGCKLISDELKGKDVDVSAFHRYREREKACKTFLVALQDSPLADDKRLLL